MAVHIYKKELDGFYKPTFFSLVINRENLLNENNKIKAEFDYVFFHEYIHYLQDLLTTFGIRNMAFLAQKYCIINHEIIHADSNYFKIPYQSQNEVLLSNTKVFNIYWGTDSISNENDFEVKNISRQQDILGNSEIPLIYVDILFRDLDFTQDSFQLGAIHFMENMAALLEKKFFLTSSPPFPYRVIEKVLKQLFYDGEFTDTNFIVFMEDSLGTYHPADYLFQFNEYCNAFSLTFNETSITDFKKHYRICWGTSKCNLDSFFYPNLVYARDGFKAMFNHEKLALLKEWNKVLLSNVVKLKRANFSFKKLLVLNNNKEEVVNYMNYIIKKLGTPIVSDSTNKFFMVSPKPGLEHAMVFLFGLEAILNVLQGDVKCSCIPYCKSSQLNYDVTNELCYSTPWRRTEIQPYCLFAQLWIMWGFTKKKVQE